MQNKNSINTKNLVLASLFIALSIVFARLFSIRISEGMRISFADTPIILAGIILGPVYGLIVGILADLLGFLVAPMGAYIPWLTITSGLIGLIPGLLYRYVFKKRIVVAIIAAVLVDMLLVNGLLKTLIFSYVYGGKTFAMRFYARLPMQLVMCVVHPIVCTAIVKGAKPVLFKDQIKRIAKSDDTTINAVE